MTLNHSQRKAIWRVLLEPRLWRGPAPWVIVLLVAANMGIANWMTILAAARRENLAAGDLRAFEANSRYEATLGEAPLSTWSSIPDATSESVAILCGMSQMFSINERQPGDQMICEEMDDRLAPLGVRVYGLAAPNLCNEEALFLILALLDKPETTPKAFIYGACFDKMRNVDLRPGYQAFLTAKPGLQAAWKEAATAYQEKYPLAADKMLKTLADLQAAEQHDDNSFEGRLREKVAAWLPIVAARKELNGYLQLRLHLLRNTLLRIKPTSKRPVIRSRYEMNREFLQMMSDVCEEAGVQFITYVIPLNPLAENPYIEEEYLEFKDWLGSVAEARRVPFANLEDLVPPSDWGEFLGGPDFKHFKGNGHRLTAAKLVEEFGPVLIAPRDSEVRPDLH